MRVTFVLPHAGLAGGIRVVAIYADRLRQRGHEVVVVSTPADQPTWKACVKSFLSGRGWPRAEGKGPSHLDTLDIEHRVIDRFRPMCNDDVPDADVVIATWWQTAESVADLDAGKGAKTYFIQHDERVMYPASDSATRDRVHSTWSLPMAKITISKWLVDLLRPYCGDGGPALVANSVDAAQFRAEPRGKQQAPTVGTMYSTSAFKGCDVAFKAMELARRRVPTLRAIAFGAETPSDDLPLPADCEYHLRPAQHGIGNIYAACDAWLFASRCEGFGLPILEAMACRTPVIGTPAGAAPELIGEGGGMLVEPQSPQSMANAVVRMCKMPDNQWRQMSRQAYRTATCYDWDDATDLFERALEQVIAGSGREPMTTRCAG